MKITTNKILAALIASGLLGVAGNTIADSSYGYSSSGVAASSISAKASVKVNVTVPELILLRVGTGNVVDNVNITATPTVGGITGTLTNGNDVGVGGTTNWDGTAPNFGTSATSTAVNVYTWTNADNAKLTCAVSADTLNTINLTKAKIKVASTTLAHPGTSTACGASDSTNITRNTLMTGTWTYSIDAADVLAAYAGTASETVTYTAARI
ncbi:hypothetical protein [uncultured Thiothrix sp.]|uniref:hypothetical protein n=1 Tax=uncultured Thiothrix sp. TaxID=223185 RepID=UPI0026382387|nr:hypothetical protein [uncultured Thiothrix sp.]